jgi:hypothetical protein
MLALARNPRTLADQIEAIVASARIPLAEVGVGEGCVVCGGHLERISVDLDLIAFTGCGSELELIAPPRRLVAVAG